MAMNDTDREHAGGPYEKPSDEKKKLQTPHKIRCSAKQRVSPHAPCRGSLTLETTLVLPLLLCAVAALLAMFSFTAIQGKRSRSLMERAQVLAVTVKAPESDPYVRLYDYSRLELPYAALGFSSRPTVQKAVVRAWVGRTEECISGIHETFVYVTPDGSVYHKSSECTYLRLSIRSISGESLDRERNQSGSKYNPCETCAKNAVPARTVYVTNYGDRYHNSRSCSGLKRTVMMTPLNQVGGRGACSKCGGN